MARRLDYRPKEDTFAWLDEHEEWFFARYIEVGKVRHVLEEVKALALEDGWPIAYETVYEWIELTPDRADRWTRALSLRGHFSFDSAQDEAEAATQKDANARRLKYEAKKWAAEVQNRAAYGRRPDVQVAIGVGGEWAQALAALAEPKQVRAIPADRSEPHTGERPTRALLEPGPSDDEG